MIRYLLRRIGYGFLILIGVNLLTFMLFFTVKEPLHKRWVICYN